VGAGVGSTGGTLEVSDGRVVGNEVATSLEEGGLVGAGTGGMDTFVPNRFGALGWFEALAAGSGDRGDSKVGFCVVGMLGLKTSRSIRVGLAVPTANVGFLTGARVGPS
jgi:hypothetical protein